LTPAAITARVACGVSVISVGSSPVVPSRACAAQIARDARDARGRIEHDPVPAVDLQVHEARRQDPRPEIGTRSRRRLGPGRSAATRPSSTTSAAASCSRKPMHWRRLPVEDRCPREDLLRDHPPSHRLRHLAQMRRRVGLRPRRRASASTKA
jgi:hypothetical protein